MDKVDQALQCFKESFNCSQAIVSAYGPELGLDKEMALRVAAAFGGGIARMGETCGAVTGAMMVIGLVYGRTRAEDKETAERTNKAALAFLERFKARHFTVLCRELLGCEMGASEGREYAKTHNLHDQLCNLFVKDAAEILEELLDGDAPASV